MKKLIALLLVLALCVSAAACAKKTETPAAEATPMPVEEAAPAEAVAEEELASDASVAAKLGEYVVTVDDVAAEYEYFITYMSYYGMTAPTDPAEVEEYVDMIVDNKIADIALAWQADEQGITLSEEAAAEIETNVQAHIAEIEESYREAVVEELGEGAAEEQIAARMSELINEDVVAYMGYDFDTYLEVYRSSLVSEQKALALRENVTAGVTLAGTDAADWYAKIVEEDQAAVAEDPFAYRDTQETYEVELSVLPAFYAPEGFVRAQIIAVDMEAAAAAVYAENKTAMTALESEFGALALKGTEPTRRAEIRTEYNTLATANAEFEQEARSKAEAILTEAQTSNITFAELCKKYDESLDDAAAENGNLVYTAGADAKYPAALCEAAAALGDGDISGLIEIEGTFYIVRRVNAIPAGAVAFEEVQALAEEQALLEKKDAAWFDANETYAAAAAAAAAKYPAHYASIGK